MAEMWGLREMEFDDTEIICFGEDTRTFASIWGRFC